MIGFGARLAGGDTSLHGYSGIPLLHKRSLVAMMTFILSAMFVATLRDEKDFLEGKSATKTLEPVVSII